ncbi:hypothetical protein TNIN_413541 [Trichonephila inaurata madagascariensis]|uniref:Uncharacterized protein n=1 Tax=Trichonephila inaurata madagascariensis TaxID=2747483 RepID=A0A8X7C869_9ARAC|nr:hypothetical protein TNIN_413541 [Trichonephila inaurata madagascariensis]
MKFGLFSYLLLYHPKKRKAPVTKSSITDSDHASNNGKDEPSRNIRFHQRASESSFSFFIESRSSINPEEKTQMEDAVRIRISCPRSFFVTKLSLSL